MSESHTFNFKSVDWGPDEAKGDANLKEYFVPFPDFDDVRAGKFRYLIGRKGAGKTSAIQRIRLELQAIPDAFHSSLSLRKFPLSEFRDMRDKSYHDKSQYVSAWQFLIYIELAKLVCTDQGAEPQELVDELKFFLSENGLADSLGFTQTITTLRKSDQKLKVNVKWVAGEAASGKQVQHLANVHYHRIVEILESKLGQIQSNSQFWIFMDELDEGYQAGDINNRLVLLALMRAVEDSAIQLQSSPIDFRPLLVLRSDIFDRLDDNDSNKLDDFVLRIKWTTSVDDQQHSLRLIADARIKRSIPDITGDMWEQIVNDDDPALPRSVKSVWTYIANRTHERPRDLVKFLKYCKKTARPGMLSLEAVKLAEVNFSVWLKQEVGNEIYSYLPCWREVMACISQCGTWRIQPDILRTFLRANKIVSKWMENANFEADDIIEMLFDFGVLGTVGANDRWLFRYKDDEVVDWDGGTDLLVHFGFAKALRVKF